jgi:hypothetical protein
MRRTVTCRFQLQPNSLSIVDPEVLVEGHVILEPDRVWTTTE